MNRDPAAIAELVNSAKLATLGMLVAGVAHELNTPLGALNSNQDTLKRALAKLTGILEDEQVDAGELDEVRRIVRAIDGILRVDELAVTRMVAIVQSLRTFGRLDQADIDRVDLHEGIESTLALLRYEMGRRVHVERDFGELPLIECYPHQLNQLWMNLLLNGVQALQGGGTITVRTRFEAPHALVEVQDTGVGIEPQLLDRIWEPGFTTKGSRMGMGLGLLISRQIVEQHGGRICVLSTPGHGTAFTISLPERLGMDRGASSGDASRHVADAATSRDAD